MSDEDIYMYRASALNEAYEKARNVCDPIEFQARQKNLLENVATFLLMDYWSKEKEWNKNRFKLDSSAES